MAEKIEDLLVKGYGTWKNNLVLAAPHILSAVAVLILVFVAVVVAMIGIFAVAALSGPSISSIVQGGPAASGGYTTTILLLLALAVVAGAVFILAIFLASAFFTSGAIGMSMKAMETGKTSIDDMIAYGRKKFLAVFYASILEMLLSLLGLLLFIPAALAFLAGAPGPGLALLLLGLLALIVYLIVLQLALVLMPYAIVIKDLGAMDGLRESYGTFMKNKLATLILWFVVSAVGAGLGLAVGVFTSLLDIIPLLGALLSLLVNLCYAVFSMVVLTPIFMLWWTAYYMDKAGPSRSRFSERPSRPQSREQPSKQSGIYI